MAEKEGKKDEKQALNVGVNTYYETQEMTAKEVAEQNTSFEAMGLPVRVIDVSRFDNKMELQADGSWKRSTIKKRNDEPNTTSK